MKAAGKTPASVQRIAYLDAADLGAALALRREPALAAQPLALLDDRGQVLAVNERAATAGIAVGQSERQAAARAPALVTRPADRYPIWETQAALLAAVARYAGRWQPAGLGAAYLDLAGVGGDLASWSQALSAEVGGLGLACGLGLTSGKFSAQIAGQTAPHTVRLLAEPAAERAFVDPQPVTWLPLGPDALRHLLHLGVRTLGAYRRLPAAGVLARFGALGATAQRWAQGHDERPVLLPAELPHETLRVEFAAPVVDREILLASLLRRAAPRLTQMQARGQAVGCLTLTVTRADGRLLPGQHTFPQPAAALAPLRAALNTLLARTAWRDHGASELTLTLAEITDAPAQQLTLWAEASSPRAALTALLDQLAPRFGPQTFRMAALVEPSHPLPERRTSWQVFV
jgi:nucleotidyltransferase/DNA polymerase involved in DNA repair